MESSVAVTARLEVLPFRKTRLSQFGIIVQGERDQPTEVPELHPQQQA